MTFQRILREPMLHFLLIGCGLFLAWDRLGRAIGDEPGIVISQAVVDDLVRQHRATWNRPPSEAELTGLVEAYIHEEVLYREGVSLGLDRDDRMIKRRVRQKVELIAEEEGAPGEPTDAALVDFMTRNPAKFMRPAVADIDQVFFIFVAVEIIHARRGQVTVTQRYPWIVAFAFGLLHGLGFASALAEVGLPHATIPAALLFFNVGVEIGQVLFVGAVLTVAGLARRTLPVRLPDWLGYLPPYAIGGLASFWLIERLVAF